MSSPALDRGFLLRRIGDTVVGSSDTHLCSGGVVQQGFDPISTWLQGAASIGQLPLASTARTERRGARLESAASYPCVQFRGDSRYKLIKHERRARPRYRPAPCKQSLPRFYRRIWRKPAHQAFLNVYPVRYPGRKGLLDLGQKYH